MHAVLLGKACHRRLVRAMAGQRAQHAHRLQAARWGGAEQHGNAAGSRAGWLPRQQAGRGGGYRWWRLPMEWAPPAMPPSAAPCRWPPAHLVDQHHMDVTCRHVLNQILWQQQQQQVGRCLSAWVLQLATVTEAALACVQGTLACRTDATPANHPAAAQQRPQLALSIWTVSASMKLVAEMSSTRKARSSPRCAARSSAAATCSLAWRYMAGEHAGKRQSLEADGCVVCAFHCTASAAASGTASAGHSSCHVGTAQPQQAQRTSRMTHALMGTALAKKMPDDTRSMSTPSASSASGNSLVSLREAGGWRHAKVLTRLCSSRSACTPSAWCPRVETKGWSRISSTSCPAAEQPLRAAAAIWHSAVCYARSLGCAAHLPVAVGSRDAADDGMLWVAGAVNVHTDGQHHCRPE